MTAFVRLTFKDSKRGRRTVWAKDSQAVRVGAVAPGVRFRIFSRVTAEGEATEPREIICLLHSDVISAIPATMNMHYGQLELKKEGPTS